jgi:hypothetical protein
MSSSIFGWQDTFGHYLIGVDTGKRFKHLPVCIYTGVSRNYKLSREESRRHGIYIFSVLLFICSKSASLGSSGSSGDARPTEDFGDLHSCVSLVRGSTQKHLKLGGLCKQTTSNLLNIRFWASVFLGEAVRDEIVALM